MSKNNDFSKFKPIGMITLGKAFEKLGEQIKCEKNIKDGYLIHTCDTLKGLKEKIEK